MAKNPDLSDNLSNFLYPRSNYYGKFQPEYLVFKGNLQYFSQQVSYICNLQTGGKLSPEDAYKKIKILWKQLKSAKNELEI